MTTGPSMSRLNQTVHPPGTSTSSAPSRAVTLPPFSSSTNQFGSAGSVKSSRNNTGRVVREAQPCKALRAIRRVQPSPRISSFNTACTCTLPTIAGRTECGATLPSPRQADGAIGDCVGGQKRVWEKVRGRGSVGGPTWVTVSLVIELLAGDLVVPVHRVDADLLERDAAAG